MPIPAEVPSFEGKVCRNKYFAARRRAQNGAVIAYSERHGPGRVGSGAAADLLDEGKLSHRFWSFSHPEGSIYAPEA
jgi:hypothetical protein